MWNEGPSEPAAHIVPIEGQLNMDLFVGNAHTLTYCLKTWEVLSRRQVKSCLSGEKISTKSLDKTLGSTALIITLWESQSALSFTPISCSYQGSKANHYNNIATHFLPCIHLCPFGLHCWIPPFSLFIARLNGHAVWFLGKCTHLRRHKCTEVSLRYLRKKMPVFKHLEADLELSPKITAE